MYPLATKYQIPKQVTALLERKSRNGMNEHSTLNSGLQNIPKIRSFLQFDLPAGSIELANALSLSYSLEASLSDQMRCTLLLHIKAEGDPVKTSVFSDDINVQSITGFAASISSTPNTLHPESVSSASESVAQIRHSQLITDSSADLDQSTL